MRRLWWAKEFLKAKLGGRPAFQFAGREHRLWIRWYNRTWVNERQVELPVAWDRVQGYEASEVLEVGNVLSHYQAVRHKIVDKYEQARGVENVDFLEYEPGRRFRCIVAISTFEHIGWDEPDRDASKFQKALDHAVELLEPGGLLFITLPLGWNPAVDEFLAAPPHRFDVKFLAKNGVWQQVPEASPQSYPYNPVGAATAIGVVEYRKPQR
jgi:SAM-dependent methyltransferase